MKSPWKSALLIILIALASCGGDSSSTPTSSSGQPCCKYCTPPNQACGDTCIAPGLTCNKPTGCACMQ